MVNRYDYVSLIAIACIFLVIEVHAELFQIRETRAAQKICGPLLADMLAIVCNGKYITQKYKRSLYASSKDMNTMENNKDYQQPLHLDDAKLPILYRSLTKAAALPSGSFRFRRYTRSISEDCCKRICTVDQIKSYCSIQ